MTLMLYSGCVNSRVLGASAAAAVVVAPMLVGSWVEEKPC